MDEEKSYDAAYKAFLDTGKKIRNKLKALPTTPIKNVGESWHLKNTRLPRLRLPNLDTAPMSIDLEYTLSKMALQRTENRLAKTRFNLTRKVAFLNQQWKSLRQKEDMLREEFRRFNKFLRTNMDKRERALKKYAFDKETNMRRNCELNNLKQKIETLKNTLSNMQKEISKYRIYERYLEEVIQASGGEFKDSSEILPRVEILMNTKEAIRERLDQDLECLQDTVGYSIRFIGSKMQTVVSLSGMLPIAKTKYEETQFRRLQLEYLMVNLKAKLTDRLANLLVHRNAIDNIYKQILTSRNIPENWQNDDIFFKMMVIGRTLQRLETMPIDSMEKSKQKRTSSIRGRQSKEHSRVSF